MDELRGFLSYARFDDLHGDNLISDLRDELRLAVRAATGVPFPIFQDSHPEDGVQVGEPWKHRINEELHHAAFLIAIVTPSYLRSEACRFELERFAELERAAGHSDRIIPIYYRSCLDLEQPAWRAKDPLAQLLADRQRDDWREVPGPPSNRTLLQQKAHTLAKRIRDLGVAHGLLLPSGAIMTRPDGALSDGVDAAAPRPQLGDPAQRSPDGDPANDSDGRPGDELVADPSGHGEFTTISAAITAASPGTRILVRPGVYEEPLRFDKAVEILCDPPGSAIVQIAGVPVVSSTADGAELVGLGLRQLTSDGPACVEASAGRIVIRTCTVTGGGAACVVVRGTAEATIEDSRIAGSAAIGVALHDEACGQLRYNDIQGMSGSGVTVEQRARAVLRDNNIHRSQNGVVIDSQASSILERNRINDNRLVGVVIAGGTVTAAGNEITRNRFGISLIQRGAGRFETNDLRGNTGGAWQWPLANRPNVELLDNRE